MPAGSTPPRPPQRQRSTTALVLSRSTTGPLSEAAERTPTPGDGAPTTSWRWAVVTWIILGAAIAALWALLLLGDSLAPMPQ